jgi:hypothetical protein
MCKNQSCLILLVWKWCKVLFLSLPVSFNVSLISYSICIYVFGIILRLNVIWWEKIPLLHAQTSPSYYPQYKFLIDCLPSSLPSCPHYFFLLLLLTFFLLYIISGFFLLILFCSYIILMKERSVLDYIHLAMPTTTPPHPCNKFCVSISTSPFSEFSITYRPVIKWNESNMQTQTQHDKKHNSLWNVNKTSKKQRDTLQ